MSCFALRLRAVSAARISQPATETMSTRHPHEGEPHLLHSLTEWRALIEMAVLPYAVPCLMAGAAAATGTRCCCCPASWPTR